MVGRAYTVLVLALVAASMAGCKNDPNFCEGAPRDNCLAGDAGDDVAKRCTSNAGCESPTPVCDVSGSGTCVECTAEEAEACSGTTPVCGEDNTCAACSAHDQCASGACAPDGSCAAETDVAYVGGPGSTDNATCTKATPCTKVAKALATNRDIVKFAGTTDEGVTVGSGRIVTFLADPGAKLTRSAGGAIVTVRDDGTSLTINDLSISDAPNNASGFGIVVPTASGAPTVILRRVTLDSNPAGAISFSGGTLTVSQSTLSGNAGGGISVSGAAATFVIVNNLMFNNGSNTAAYGAVDLTGDGNDRFEFNTLTQNTSDNGEPTAIDCAGSELRIRNNIIWANQDKIVGDGLKHIDGTCQVADNIVGPMMGTPTPPGNLGVDPKFIDPGMDDFQIKADSPARGVAAADSVLSGLTAIDYWGDPRPNPAGQRADVGADEAP